ncbi:hypothetical protein [Inquilinus sp.]|jgi:hypothetical protein|uniref:hypothetical protein n=1 Tax=Inquilinus sp. TaxID=1932117 RepID=UPI003783FF4A
MPVAIPLVLVAGATFTGGLAAAGVGLTIAGVALSAGTLGAISAGLSIAGTLAGMLLAPKPPKPKFADGSASVKQAVPPRVRCYGTYRLAGAYVYFISTDEGDLKAITCHCAHEVDAFVEHWLADEPVTINGSGFVDSGVYDNYDPILPVKVVNYLGTPDQSIAGIADEWTVDHRGRGLCCTYVQYSDMKAELQQKVFANGAPPYRVTLRGAKVFDPRLEGTGPGQHDPEDEATWTWSDNAALVILDYLTRTEFGVPVGFGLPFTRMNLDSFAEAADVSDQLIPKKAGGTEKRWRSCGAYELTEERKSVLSDLLDACAGRLTQGPDGRLGLSVGAGKVAGADVAGMPTAAVTVTEDHIIGFDFGPGVTALDRVNEVRATYVSADQAWAEVEAGIHRDQDAIDRNGLESSAIKLRFVPAEGQAQRVARAGLLRGNPTLAGKITGSLKLLDAWGERWIRLVLTEMDVDQIFEVTGLRFNPANLTVEMDLTSYDSWWDWDPEEDERDKADIPLPPPPVPDTPEPTGVVATIMHRQQNAQTMVATMAVSWDAPPSASLQAQGRWRENPGGALQMVRVEPDATSFETPPLEDGKAYRGEVRFVGSRNTASDWVAATPVTAVADPVAPASPTNLTAQANAPATGQVTVSAIAPNDPRHLSLRFYRNSSSSFAGATLIDGPLYCAPLSAQTYVDAPAAGDWWYFATSSNSSNVASAPAGGVLAEVSPATIVILSPAPPGPVSTYDRRQPVSGDGATPGAPIKLYSNGVQVGTSTAAGDGTWSVTPSSDLAIGADMMTATQVVGGNESLPSGAVTLNVTAIDPDAWAFIAAMTVRPPFVRQTLIKTLVDSLKTAGVWTKLDALYLLAAHDAQAARLNAKAPATFALTAVSSPTFTVDRGYTGTGNGVTPGGYLTSGFNPATAGGLYALNDAHLAVWVRTASSSTVNSAMSEVGNGLAFISSKNATAGTIITRLNDNISTGIAAGAPNSTEFFCISRAAAGTYDRYHNGTSLGALAQASTSVFSDAFTLLRRGTTTYSDAQVSAASWGSALTPTQEGDYHTALRAYLVAVGAA